ncbi:hypothetical protein [Mycolicibacterium neoaurum]|uniref:hypothetical protein n=1 Tax=Mycolicibacterium neoaurum TaxID=1795 RepID=UPI001F4C8B92|nr:hypothetical protein [Mycolicibacterium neoaurum]
MPTMRYAVRLQPVMDDISRRYPAMAPSDFDPSYTGESWDEDPRLTECAQPRHL